MKVKSVCVPIDPDNAGSVVSGWVRFPEIANELWGSKKEYINLTASLALSDCSKVINWSFYAEDGGFDLAKLDRAIAALCEFRAYMLEAHSEYAPLKAEVDKRNADKKEETVADLQLRLSDVRDNL